LEIVEELVFRNIALARGREAGCSDRGIPGAEPVLDCGRGVAAVQAVQALWQGPNTNVRRHRADVIHKIAIGDHGLGVLEREVGPIHSRLASLLATIV